ncbi:MAG: alkaline phosphatase family protein [Planctomycetota bacterium]
MGLKDLFRRRKPRRVVCGLDGVPFAMLKGFAADGTMPRLAGIIAASRLAPMRSSVPHISSVAWSSLVTGRNPGEHGIFGFVELAPGSYDFTFPDSGSLRANPFWLDEPDRRHAIINVPSTYPARPLNGVLIAGFVAVDLARATYPPELLPTLREFNYSTDADAAKGHTSLDAFMEDLHATHAARVRAAMHIFDREHWDTFFFVITETDRLCHFLYEAYANPAHARHAAFRDYFRRVDEALGALYDRLDETDLFMMISDHGFGRLDAEVHLNRVLVEHGLLKLAGDAPQSFNAIAPGTRAFALDPSRVYVHTRDRYPRGEVAPADRGRVIAELEDLFTGLMLDGRKVIKRIHRRDDVFHGPQSAQGPDLVLVEEDGFDLKARLAAPTVTGRGAFTGRHTPDDAFILVRPPQGMAAAIPENVSVYDFRHIMEAATPWKR